MLLMFVVFLGVLIGANIYLAKRFTWYFNLDSARLFYFLIAGITVFMIGSVMGAVNSVSSIGHIVYMVGAVTMGFVLYLLISTIAVDLLSLIVKMRPILYGLASISLAALISIYGLWNATNLQVSEVDIPLKNITKSIRAAHLTDTHLGHVCGWFCKQPVC